MADAITQALTDLTAAVTAATAEISTLVATIAADQTASAETTAAAAQIETLAGNLNTAVAAVPTSPTPPATAPVVSVVDPASGGVAGGDPVALTGTGFTGATAVAFGTLPATDFTVDSDTSITATSPAANAGVVDVTVTTPEGTSVVSVNDQFTYA